MQSTQHDTGKMHWGVHVAIGLAIGILAIIIDEVRPESRLAVTAWAALWTFCLGAGFIAQMSHVSGRIRQTALASALLGVLFAIPMAWIFSEAGFEQWGGSGQENRIFTGVMSLCGSLCILLAFARTWLDTGRLHFPYKKLFDHSLDSLNIVTVAAVFTGCFWLLLLLWAGLFDLLGISYFTELFSDQYFIYLALPTSVSVGFCLGRASENVVQALKRFLLVICQVLLPMVALIVGLFLIALVVKGLEALWDTNLAASLLLSLQVLIIFLFNGVVQLGDEPPQSRVMRSIVEGVALSLPILAALSWYALILRIGQYGLTPERAWAMATGLVSTLYGLGYALSVILAHVRRQGWLDTMRPVNVGMAFFIPLLMILMHTPVLDPLHHSARNQYARLLDPDTDISTFSLYGLRYEYGRLGREYIQDLEQNMDAMVEQGVFSPERAEILTHRLEEEDYYAPDSSIALTPDHVEMLDGMELDPRLFETIEGVFDYQGWYYEGPIGAVMARPFQADNDPDQECLVFIQDSYNLLFVLDRNEDGEWFWAGYYDHDNMDPEVLRSLFPGAPLTPTPRQYLDMELGGTGLRFQHANMY